MALSFDELNKLYDGKRSMPYEKYFGEMELPQEEKKKRISFSIDLELILVFLFSSIYADFRANRSIDVDFYRRSVKGRFIELLESYSVIIDDATRKYVNDTVDVIIDTTVDYIENDKWYVSTDRAKFDAENESNNVFDEDDYKKAIASGKQNKRWKTMRDASVRHSHREVADTVVGINEYFIVNGYKMKHPHDSTYAPPSEIINCRCVAEYF